MIAISTNILCAGSSMFSFFFIEMGKVDKMGASVRMGPIIVTEKWGL